MKLTIRWQPLVLFGLTLLGFSLRLYGLNWDQGNSFHPDERQILFHVTALSWPTSMTQFLDAATSPLNPHFFAYGSFPLYLLAFLGHLLLHPSSPYDAFTRLTLLGRVLSALFDSGTILLTGLLGLAISKDTPAGHSSPWTLALLSAALIAFTPLQLQLAHFFAVDSMLLFFVMLTLLACVHLAASEKPLPWLFLCCLGYGLALATKLSSAPLIVPLMVALLLRWYRLGDFVTALVFFTFSSAMTLVVFLIAQPYALLDRQEFIQQVLDQSALVRGSLDLPYVRQFAGTIPIVYEVQNMFLWGMGVTLGLAVGIGLCWLCWRIWHRNAGAWLVVFSWVLIYGGINCSFYAKFMRYMLPVYPALTLIGVAGVLALVHRSRSFQYPALHRLQPALPILQASLIVLVLAGTIFQGLALLNVYSSPNTRIQASRWIYSHLKPGSKLTYEQWDDPLPVSVDGHDPSIFEQVITGESNGQPVTGLDLYGDDTIAKARQLANVLATVDAITMPTDRLDKSIPRLPDRYPLTIHYYQLLFSGQLGFHLAAQFENHPHLFGITLDDSSADESYSVFDHPTARIFVRDTPYPYTTDQLFGKLLQGVRLPPAGADLSGAQHSLLLSAQQIDDNQSSPPLAVQFPAHSPANQFPILFWWLALFILGLVAYPLAFSALRGLADGGYLFSKLLGVLLLAYLAWLLSYTHLLPFIHTSLVLALGIMSLVALLACFWQREALVAFLRRKWRIVLGAECLFCVAYLLFVAIRALNPDLWHFSHGGEKPMELAFLHAVLRSSYMPPYDPWFAGGYINYYYYGYVIIGSLIKLIGIVPTVAFNLAIPTLFALTFASAVLLVYSFSQRLPVALLAGYLSAMLGNFNALIQLKGQLLALFSQMPVPTFDYWQSSRVIPFTINEFPFWSFLFADLHPHVIDMPITLGMLTLLSAFFLPLPSTVLAHVSTWRRLPLFLLLAFVFGTIACVNPWDMPVYAVFLVLALLVRKLQLWRQTDICSLLLSLAYRLAAAGLLCALGYLFYWPFHASFQELYVSGLGFVAASTAMSDYLVVFGFWLFLALSFFCIEVYQLMAGFLGRLPLSWHGIVYMLSWAAVLMVCLLLGIRALLTFMLLLGGAVFTARILGAPAPGKTVQVPLREQKSTPMYTLTPSLLFTYLLFLLGLAICLGIELVYVRDFLDGGSYARMNTVFKFSMQAWLCLAIGGALAVQRLWSLLRGLPRALWRTIFVALLLCCSLFPLEGTIARAQERQVPPVSSLQSDDNTPTLDGFAFVQKNYPADAQAITWLNEHVTGSPVILEANVPVSYQWYGRVSVYTGLPDVLGWLDHENEQRYSQQALDRLNDIEMIYTTTDPAQALELLRFQHVCYIYIGPLERQLYAGYPPQSLGKFEQMVGSTLLKVYDTNGVVIYEVL